MRQGMNAVFWRNVRVDIAIDRVFWYSEFENLLRNRPAIHGAIKMVRIKVYLGYDGKTLDYGAMQLFASLSKRLALEELVLIFELEPLLARYIIAHADEYDWVRLVRGLNTKIINITLLLLKSEDGVGDPWVFHDELTKGLTGALRPPVPDTEEQDKYLESRAKLLENVSTSCTA